MGIDHDLQVWTGATGTCVTTSNAATPSGGPTPSSPTPATGWPPSGKDLLGHRRPRTRTTTSPTTPGSSSRRPGLSWDSPRTIDGYELDNAPLWEFIDPIDTDGNGVQVPTSCAKSVFTSVLANNYSVLPNSPADVRGYISGLPTKAEQMRALIERCLTHYVGDDWDGRGPADGLGPIGPQPDDSSCPTAGCTDVVFGRNSSTSDVPDLYDIQYTPRFGYVPLLTTDFGSPAESASTYRLASFRAIWIQRVFGDCSTGGGCDLDFEPAVPVLGNDAPNGGSAEGMTAYQFPATILPNGLAGENAPFEIGTNRFIRLIR